MLNRSTPKLAVCLSAVAVTVFLSGCVTMGAKQEKQVLAPAPDANVANIITHVKQDPSVITGGGMIYELFVGDRFAARYNEKSQVLKLTDFDNEGACEYDINGNLALPESADESYLNYCSHLSTNTIDYLNQ